MIDQPQFWGAIILGAIIGGAMVSLFEIFRHNMTAGTYRVHVYTAPAQPEPSHFVETTDLGEALAQLQEARRWKGTHHIIILGPHGGFYSWKNPDWRQ